MQFTDQNKLSASKVAYGPQTATQPVRYSSICTIADRPLTKKPEGSGYEISICTDMATKSITIPTPWMGC